MAEPRLRLALHATGDLGHRAGRILLAEPDLEALGIYGPRRPATEDRRSTAITDLAGFSVLISDDATAPFDLAAIAVADGLSCVLAAPAPPDPELAARFAAGGLSLLTGAALPGLAEALALATAAEAGGPAELLVAWTRPGKPLRRGRAVPFPEPVGARWGTRLRAAPGGASGTTRVEVPVEGPWGGVLARVSRRRVAPGGRLLAAADDAGHLEAIALAAGSLVVGQGAAPPGAVRPGDVAGPYLAAALRVGLELAGLEPPS